MNLEKEIELVVAELSGGKDPATVLRSFAEKAKGPTERIVQVHSCVECGEEDALCFQCKAREVVGDQVTMAAPMVLPKLVAMVKGWAGEAFAKRAAAAQQAQQQAQARSQASCDRNQGWHAGARPGPAPQGRQTF